MHGHCLNNLNLLLFLETLCTPAHISIALAFNAYSHHNNESQSICLQEKIIRQKSPAPLISYMIPEMSLIQGKIGNQMHTWFLYYKTMDKCPLQCTASNMCISKCAVSGTCYLLYTSNVPTIEQQGDKCFLVHGQHVPSTQRCSPR